MCSLSSQARLQQRFGAGEILRLVDVEERIDPLSPGLLLVEVDGERAVPMDKVCGLAATRRERPAQIGEECQRPQPEGVMLALGGAGDGKRVVAVSRGLATRSRGKNGVSVATVTMTLASMKRAPG